MRASVVGTASKSVTPPRPDWSQILIDAVSQPGIISTAYSAFWNYSTGNQFLALFECMKRGIPPGPIHTFNGWLKLDRHVRRGEKAITLCMPVLCKAKVDPAPGPEEKESSSDPPAVRRRFVYRPNWFVLSQTEGKPYVPLVIPAWEEAQACHELMIDRDQFRHLDGNCQGYALERRFAVSPIAFQPHRTMFHEMAHIVLGHTAEMMGMTDREERTPRDIREVEAEAVALICCQSLGLPGEEFSRGYLQHWLGRQKIEERTAQRIFHAADTILRAGRKQSQEPDPHEAN